jgi:hypothetical protein
MVALLCCLASRETEQERQAEREDQRHAGQVGGMEAPLPPCEAAP